MSPVSLRRAALIAGATALAASACSPVFNWREVPIGGDAELVALLPCKPDRARRDLPLGGQSVAVNMIGCETGGATFAVAQTGASDPAQAQAWLNAWHAQARRQFAASHVQERAATVAHAAATPAPLQFEAGQDGQPPQIRQRWFAHAQRNGIFSLYQATVLGAPSSPDAAQTFFEGLRLP